MIKLLLTKFFHWIIVRVKRSYFPVFIVVSFLVFATQKAKIALPDLLNNYANDFFCLPIVLFIGQYGVRMIKSDRNLRLPVPLLLCTMVYYSLYFEYYLPGINPRYTSDPVDITLYFFGTLFFYVVEYGFQKE